MTDNQSSSRLKNLTIVGILALTGFVAFFFALLMLFIGLWLDKLLGWHGPATIFLLVLSVPISLFLMIRLALAFVPLLDLPMPQNDEVSSDKKEE